MLWAKCCSPGRVTSNEAIGRLRPLTQLSDTLPHHSASPHHSAASPPMLQRFQAEGTVRQNYVSILWMLLRLRQACNHPWLVKGSRHLYQHTQAAPASAEVRGAVLCTLGTLPMGMLRGLPACLRD